MNRITVVEATATGWWRCCQCPKQLGKYENGQLIVKHQRLDTQVPLPVARQCPKCAVWNALVTPGNYWPTHDHLLIRRLVGDPEEQRALLTDWRQPKAS